MRVRITAKKVIIALIVLLIVGTATWVAFMGGLRFVLEGALLLLFIATIVVVRARRLLITGIALLTLGMAVAVLGVTVSSLFFPGLFGIMFGLIALAGGAIASVVRAA